MENTFTVMVNSCDAYSDIWDIFFDLMDRYWPEAKKHPVILNTESRQYKRDGYQIQCCPSPRPEPYGARMRRHLKKVKTPYVLMLLDDFFLRGPVQTDRLAQTVRWMEENRNIVCFNYCPTEQKELRSEKYKGFHLLEPIAKYRLNMQAAMWRTKDLLKLWPAHADPWEWESIINRRTWNTAREFYFLNSSEKPIIDYGRKPGLTWGIVRGKWCKEDIVPFFQKENIQVDFTQRGWFTMPPDTPPAAAPHEERTHYTFAEKCKRLYSELHEVGGAHYAMLWLYYAFQKRRLGLDMGFEAYVEKRFNSENKP